MMDSMLIVINCPMSILIEFQILLDQKEDKEPRSVARGPHSSKLDVTPFIVHRIFEKPKDRVGISESQKGNPGVYKTL